MKRMLRGAMLGALLAGVSGPALAEDGAAVAARFGALEAVRQMALSPSGSQVSYVSVGPSGGQVMSIVDVVHGTDPKAILKQNSATATLHHCVWASDDYLLCYVDQHQRRAGSIFTNNDTFIVSSDGKDVRSLVGENSFDPLIDWGGVPGHVLVVTGYGIEDVDLKTRARRMVEHWPSRISATVTTDGHGTLRVMSTYGVGVSEAAKGTRYYHYRKKGEREWFDLSTVTISADGLESGFHPYGVDPEHDLAYGFDNHDGRRALFTVRLDGSKTREVVLARPDVDIDRLIWIGRHQRMVGASYATDRRRSEYFDPELRKLGAGLEKALPGHPVVEFVDASADENKLLLFAGSDVDPGSYYLYDKTTHQLGSLLPVRPALAGQALAPMKPITFPAADGTLIPGYLTLPVGGSGKGLPAIVMPHGGPGARDEWGFDWLAQFFAARGFAVIQPNYRGSAGYGSQWYQKNGFKSWRTAIGDVNDATHWLISQGIADANRMAIVGWSYGGYAALQAQVLDPDLYKASVAIAPVTDLALLKFSASATWSSDWVERFIGTGPHVAEGSPALNAGRFKAPVLMFHGNADSNVDIDQSRHMANALRSAGKSVELIEYPGLTHSLPSSTARTDMLTRADAFLRKALGIN